MHYAIFNKDIIISDGHTVRCIDNAQLLPSIFEDFAAMRLCVVDVDVMIATATENSLAKKDSLLAQKFNALYPNEKYLILDERIDKNLFQVMGVKADKLRAIYALIPSSKVVVFIAYGMALRAALIGQGLDLNQMLVMVDDWGADVLITVFHGLKFSRTRVIARRLEDILPEIKRSQIDFLKKTQEYTQNATLSFSIVVNNQDLVTAILNDEDSLSVHYLNLAYPAIEGLKNCEHALKYRLPEEIIQKRKRIALKKRLLTTAVTLMVFIASGGYCFVNRITFEQLRAQYVAAQKEQTRLQLLWRMRDRQTYRSFLHRQPRFNYAVPYLEILNALSVGDAIDALTFTKKDHWVLDIVLSTDTGESPELLSGAAIFKNAVIKDRVVDHQMKKQVSLIL